MANDTEGTVQNIWNMKDQQKETVDETLEYTKEDRIDRLDNYGGALIPKLVEERPMTKKKREDEFERLSNSANVVIGVQSQSPIAKVGRIAKEAKPKKKVPEKMSVKVKVDDAKKPGRTVSQKPKSVIEKPKPKIPIVAKKKPKEKSIEKIKRRPKETSVDAKKPVRISTTGPLITAPKPQKKKSSQGKKKANSSKINKDEILISNGIEYAADDDKDALNYVTISKDEEQEPTMTIYEEVLIIDENFENEFIKIESPLKASRSAEIFLMNKTAPQNDDIIPEPMVTSTNNKSDKKDLVIDPNYELRNSPNSKTCRNTSVDYCFGGISNFNEQKTSFSTKNERAPKEFNESSLEKTPKNIIEFKNYEKLTTSNLSKKSHSQKQLIPIGGGTVYMSSKAGTNYTSMKSQVAKKMISNLKIEKSLNQTINPKANTQKKPKSKPTDQPVTSLRSKNNSLHQNSSKYCFGGVNDSWINGHNTGGNPSYSRTELLEKKKAFLKKGHHKKQYSESSLGIGGTNTEKDDFSNYISQKPELLAMINIDYYIQDSLIPPEEELPKSTRIHYPNGVIKFFGHLVNEKRWGMGTCYHQTGSIMYNGHFWNDKMHDTPVKLWNEFGGIEFEGTFYFGKKEGEGTIYHLNNMKKFTGQFLNDKIHQENAQLFSADGNLYFEGNILNGMKEGHGKLYNPDCSLKFEGNFQGDQIHGENIKLVRKYQYSLVKKRPTHLCSGITPKMSKYKKTGNVLEFEGTILNGMKQGFGKEYDEKGKCYYEGTFQNDLYHGKNCKFYNIHTGILLYEGGFANGVKEGHGVIYDKEGRLVYSGTFNNNMIRGNSVNIYWPNGNLKYEGDMLDGIREGWGRSYNEHGVLEYEGGWKEDIWHGKECLEYQPVNGVKGKDVWLSYQGELCHGARRGLGRVMHRNGKVMYQGELKNGIPMSKVIWVYNDDGSVRYFGPNLIKTLDAY